MAKFKFFEDKEARVWIRDYFTVEAETLNEAIEYVKNMGCTFADDECKKDTKCEFVYRDMDTTLDCIAECDVCAETDRYSIYSCDLIDDDTLADPEVVRVG